MKITAFDLAQRFVGLQEIPGKQDNPQILAMLKLDGKWPEHDEVPWCGAFAGYIAWLLRLPRPKGAGALRARAWLLVGSRVALWEARPGFDVVVLKRGSVGQPGPSVIEAPGHVGFLAGRVGADSESVWVLGGNQEDTVSVAEFPSERILGVRRLA